MIDEDRHVELQEYAGWLRDELIEALTVLRPYLQGEIRAERERAQRAEAERDEMHETLHKTLEAWAAVAKENDYPGPPGSEESGGEHEDETP